MPVATIPTYDDMWVDPRVVAALSDGTFEWTDATPWSPTVDYPRCANVLHGTDVPYGGTIWTATADAPAGTPPPGDTQTLWAPDYPATINRLALYTATTQATWVLDTLTGYRLHGIECWSEDYAVHTCTIRLRRTPVTAVASVTRIRRCNQPAADVPEWCWKSSQEISVCCGGCGFAQFGCGCDDNVVRIVYQIGANLPPGTEAVAAWLANEYGKAAAGRPCALPERITNVTRQGVSWSVLDPQDFLDKGFTGMTRIDNWLVPVKSTLGATLIDPLTSNRLFSERVDCAEPIVGILFALGGNATMAGP